MTRIRQPAVADLFYPGEARELRRSIHHYLSLTTQAPLPVKALIAPHAGYIYSGEVAASAYACLEPYRMDIHLVVLLGPSHHLGFEGVALSDAEAFQTPLGLVPLDYPWCTALKKFPYVHVLEDAHVQEHSLEVQLPFLQATLDSFSLIPLVVGHARVGDVCDILEFLWDIPETIFVVSSDLTHFLDYETANRVDQETSRAIETFDEEAILCEHACGRTAILALLRISKQKGLRAETLDLRNSGDTAGSRERVVGYGAFCFRTD